jgi:hypothetical protein
LGRDRAVMPLIGRSEDPNDSDKIRYFLGVDPARAEGKKSADGAMVALRAEPVVKEPGNSLADWSLSYVWAYKVRNADVDQWSALIHLKERHFRFSGICMDHGGGGNFIKDKLADPRQRINDLDETVVPISRPEDITVAVANCSLILFHHGDESIRRKWDHAKGADNVLDIGHTELREAIDGTRIAFPATEREFPQSKDWTPEKQWALRLVHVARGQLRQIHVMTDNDGKALRTRNNAQQFMARGKKDFGMAAMHAYVRFLVWLKHSDNDYQPADEDADMMG